MAEEKINELDIELLQPNPLQARGLIMPESLTELVSSIKEHGILEPLVVAKTPAGYQIIAGERRWRAAKLLGLAKVPVVLRETTTRGMLEMALVENVQREDLNPIERARAFKRLVEEFGQSISEVAKKIGKSISYVSNSMRLLSLPDAIKDGLISGAVTEGHARAISGLAEPRLMVEAYKVILAENASVRRAEDLTRRLKREEKRGTKRIVDFIHSDELDQMAERLGNKLKGSVEIVQTKVEARVLIKVRGNLEQTTVAVKGIYQKLAS